MACNVIYSMHAVHMHSVQYVYSMKQYVLYTVCGICTTCSMQQYVHSMQYICSTYAVHMRFVQYSCEAVFVCRMDLEGGS